VRIPGYQEADPDGDGTGSPLAAAEVAGEARLPHRSGPGSTPARLAVPLALLLLLAIALLLRLNGFNWDSNQAVHPDERAVEGWVARLSFPNGIGDLFTAESGWNPAWNAAQQTHDWSGFNYGSLPLYLIFLFAHLMTWLGGIFPWWSGWKTATNYPDLILAGRVLSAYADTVTVLLVFLIGRRLAGSATGLVAAALATFAVLSIQLAHFTTVDTMLATFSTATLLASIDIYKTGTKRSYVLAGVFMAAAIATKASAAPFIAIPVLAHFWHQWRIEDLWGWRSLTSLALAAVAGLVALFVFQPYMFVDWSDYWTALQQQEALARGTTIVFYTRKWAGTSPIIYPLQQLTYYSLGIPLALLGYLGVALSIARGFTRQRDGSVLVALFILIYFLSAATLYMKYLRYMEPIVPALCVAAALGVTYMVRWCRASGKPSLRLLWAGLATLLVLLNTAYGLAYEHIYAEPLTRIQASCWIYAHIPAGTLIAQDNFDETIPLNVNGCNGTFGQYQQAANGGMPTYDDDDLIKVQTMASIMAATQYYFISSRRAMDTFAVEPLKSPFTHHFYQILLGSRLGAQDAMGFTLVAFFSEHPQLGPWIDDDYSANQNFNEYDHPPVYIFKNTGHFSSAQIADAITVNNTIQPPSQFAIPPKSLLLTHGQIAANQHTPPYGTMFPAGGFPMQHPIIAWLVMLELIGLAALPLTLRLFGRLRDGGFILAKTAGILLMAYGAWILASVGLAEHTRTEIFLCLVGVAALSLLWGVRPSEVWPMVRARRVPIIATECSFLLAFGVFVYIRMLYPDMWHIVSGGEKTMDFSFINAIVRSRTMPPLDPWFGGGYLNYYYYGHYTVATLIKLAAITPAVAINLALPTWFALAFASCVSLGYHLAGKIRYGLLAAVFALVSGNLYAAQILVDDLEAASPTHAALQPVTSAGVDWFLVGGIIDLISVTWSVVSGFVQGVIAVVLGVLAVLSGHATLPQYVFGVGWPWDGSRVIDDHHVITEFPFWTFLFADPHAHLWDIPFVLCVLGLVLHFVGNEGNLPEPSPPRSISLVPGVSLIEWPVMGAIVGAIGPTEPWDFAAVLGALALGLYIGQVLRGSGWRFALLAATVRIVLLAGFALVLYYPFYNHFQSFYKSIGLTLLRHQTSVGDFLTVFGFFVFVLASYLVVAVLVDTNVGYWLRERVRTGLFTLFYWRQGYNLRRLFGVARHLGRRHLLPTTVRTASSRARALYLLTAGLALMALVFQYYVLAVLLVALALVIVPWLDDMASDRSAREEFAPSGPVIALLIVGAPALGALLIVHYWVLAMLCAMGILVGLLLIDQRGSQSASVAGLHLVLLVGLALVAAGEIVYVKDFYDGDPVAFRNNTVFKLYEEAWVMLGLAGAVGLARMLGPLWRGLPARTAIRMAPPRGMVATGAVPEDSSTLARRAPRRPPRPGFWTIVWGCSGLLLFIGAMVYPLRITPLRVSERQIWSALRGVSIAPTLDGSLFLKYVYPGDYAAIQWMNSTIAGTPIVLQSRYGNYRDFAARVTMFTGLPSVINWGFEASQQRYDQQQANATQIYPDEIAPREQDVDTIYSTVDTGLALQLLHKYQVGYIFVGAIEIHGDADDGGHPNGYPADGLAKFNTMVRAHQLARVYDRFGTTIYKVVG
jgi:YYY domain-containing protein